MGRAACAGFVSGVSLSISIDRMKGESGFSWGAALRDLFGAGGVGEYGGDEESSKGMSGSDRSGGVGLGPRAWVAAKSMLCPSP